MYLQSTMLQSFNIQFSDTLHISNVNKKGYYTIIELLYNIPLCNHIKETAKVPTYF